MDNDAAGPGDADAEPPSSTPPEADLTRSPAPALPSEPSSAAPRSTAIPARLGSYLIKRVLGEGGMGTVFEAQQESPRRTVALKVIKAGYLSPELLRRFTQESQVLGMLQHPGIAQVYEAGVVKDERGHELPFFAMEFIKGVPLTEFAASRRLGTRERLELVAKICDAVDHAHQKGVIHRDLKPGNIIVDGSGQPKILDFGVARATDSDIQQTTMLTDVGQLIGTIPYMSPEQVTGDPNELDTRSDVYALGVIAYELLAGRLPYDLKRKMVHEAARIIREEEPTRLSSINRTLRGDVETIVAKAREKEKARRYQSSESLASDIRRYLMDEAITARPASTWYQTRKFAKRHKGFVSGLAAAFILLVAGVIGTSIGLRQAVKARDDERAARTETDKQRDAALEARTAEQRQRETAEAQRDKAEKIAEFMSDMLKGAGPSVARGRDSTMLREMMDAAAARIEKGDLKSSPEAELRLRGRIGITYYELAAYDEAERMLEPAVALARSTHSGDHVETSDAITNLSYLYRERGDLVGAERLSREALEMSQRLFQGDHLDLAIGGVNLARNLKARGDLAGAEPLYREALEMSRRLYPGDHPQVAIGLNNLAALLHARGDLAGAEPLYRESLEMARRLHPGDHPEVATNLRNLASLFQSRGDLAQAEPLSREALDMTKRLFPGDHPGVEDACSNLAVVLRARGDMAGAEPLFRESLEMARRLYPGDHPVVAKGLGNLASVLMAHGDLAGAESCCREALDMRKRLVPGDAPETATSLNALGYVLRNGGDLAGAESVYREALEMRSRLFPGDHPEVANMLNSLGYVLQASGDPAGAEPLFVQALEMRRRVLPPGDPDIQTSIIRAAEVQEALGQYRGAESLWRELLEIRAKSLPAGDWRISVAGSCLGGALLAQSRFVDAEPPLLEGFEGLAAAKNTPREPGGPLREACQRVVKLYESWDEAEPGKGYDVKAAEWRAELEALTPAVAPSDHAPSAPKDGR